MNINFKDKKTWLIIGAIVLVVVVVVIIIRRRKNKQEEENKDNNDGSGNGSTGNANDTKFPLKPGSPLAYSAANGSYGWPITLIQTALNECHDAGLTVDGKFGVRTETALKSNYYMLNSQKEITEGEFKKMVESFVTQYAGKGVNRTYDDLIKQFKK